jgi:NHL repeat
MSSADRKRARRVVLFVALLALAGLFATLPAAASAAPQALWQRCDGGAEDLQCLIPRGIGVNRATGHVYLADSANSRIVELTAWGELVRAWGWGVADGGEELQVCTVAASCQEGLRGGGRGELVRPQGVAVDANGNVYVAEGDFNNRRVQKFDSEGHFLLMIGGKVNKTKVEEGKPESEQNLCPIAPTDVCQAATEGSGNGQFGTWVAGSFIAPAPAPANLLYVGDQGRIQVFNPNGTFKENFPDPDGTLAKGTVQSLAVNPSPASGTLYVAFEGKDDVQRWKPNGEKLEPPIIVKAPKALAVDAGGALANLYVASGSSSPLIRKFNSSLLEVESWGQEEPPAPRLADSTGIAAGSACFKSPAKKADVYVSDTGPSFVRAYGPVPDKLELCPKPVYPPRILSQFTLSATTDSAAVRASIDPRFDAGTTYFVQYANAACLEGIGGWAEPCVKEQPAPPGLALGAGVIDFPFSTAKVFLRELEPGTDYRYRFAAESGGGSVFGVGGEVGADGEDATFRTFAPHQPGSACPDALRIGPAAALPDCRAYELVSPVDKEGADIIVPNEPNFRLASVDRSAASGERFTYSARKAFGDSPSATYAPQYLASRRERGQAGEGWSTHAISPPRAELSLGTPPLAGADTEFKAFSEDLCSAWLIRDDTVAPPLAPSAPTGTQVPYKRSNCGPGADSYEALLTTAPHRPQVGLELEGLSSDGTRAFYSANDTLLPGVPDPVSGSSFERALYESFGGSVQPGAAVCRLPGGTMSKTCSAGTAHAATPENRITTVAGAVSGDGSRVYWSSSYKAPAKLFVRVNPSEAQSALANGNATGKGTLSAGSDEITGVTSESGAFAVGQGIVAETQATAGGGIPYGTTIVAVEGSTLRLSAVASGSGAVVPIEAFSACTQPALACTLPVSGGKAQFWAASADGSRAIFTGGVLNVDSVNSADLFEFDLEAALKGEAGAERLIAGKVAGVMGASADASRIYFISAEALSGEEENSEGDVAQPGAPNLYLYEAGEGGEFSFIATLAKADAVAQSDNPFDWPSPVSVLPATHSARVTPDGETLAFMAVGTPTGADNVDVNSGEADSEVYRYSARSGKLECVSCNPSGARPAGRNVTVRLKEFWAAGRLPNPENQHYAQRALSEDGGRLFFESFEPLVSADTNRKQDVYEWEAVGSGSCMESSPAFSPPNGGCVSLISSGESPEDSDFLDADATGDEVFFRTGSNLVPKDPGLFDVYDARVDGGFPEAQVKAPCEGEACQSPPPAPEDPTPSSETFLGPGNHAAARCAKGKQRVVRHGKARCVAKKGKGKGGRQRHSHRRAKR